MRVEINDNELEVEVLGPDGAPVVVAHHGAPGLGSKEEPLASFGRLADTYRVVVFDARGSGLSGGKGPFSHEQWAADVDGLRQWMGVEQIVMAGGSYGGFISLEYAVRYPDRVRAIVLRDTAADNANSRLSRANALASTRVAVDMELFDRMNEGRVHDDEDMKAIWRALLPLYDYDYDPDRVEDKLAAMPDYRYRHATHNYAFGVNLPAYDLKPVLSKVTAPTLVTVGRADWITPPECSETIVGLMPNARLAVFEESGHSPQVEQAEEWIARVREFLAEAAPA